MRRFCIGLAAAYAIGMAMAAPVRAADYKIQLGDTLEFSVAGFGDLRQKVSVNADGNIVLPVFGILNVAGKSLGEATAALQQIVPTKAVHQRTPDGRDSLFALEPSEVSLTISDYRPIYLKGDVSKPGEQPFRPGLTVRQAVALAGGFDLVRFRVSNPFLDAADLRARYDGLWLEFARQQLKVVRLQAELDGREVLDTKSLFHPPVPTDVLNQITDLESQQLKLNQANYRAELDYLHRSVGQAQTYAGQIQELQQQLAQGTAEQTENLKRIRAAVDKGLIVLNRMTDEQRAVLNQADRTLVAASELTKAQKQLQDANRDIDRLNDKRQSALLADLQEAKTKLASISSDIQGVSDKLLYVGSLRSQLVRGTGNRVGITIVRRNDQGKFDQISANEDTSLAAGDVAEITLRTEDDYTGVNK